MTTTDEAAIADDVDLPLELDAFGDVGVELVLAPWEDESIDWTAFDLVVMRTPWNYVEHLSAFRRWLEDLDPATQLCNPAPLIAWNLDKRYLLDLASRDVPIVPTRFVDAIDRFRDAVADSARSDIVVKPAISAGSRSTGRFPASDPAAEHLAASILAEGLTVMVQPLASSVDRVGEIGTVVFDGAISHSFRKGPILADGGGLIGGEYREDITPIQASEAVLEVVRKASSAATDHARHHGWLGMHEQFLYGRFDVVFLDDGSPALLEAELFEPCFFLPIDPASVDRFLAAVLARLEV